MIRAQMLASLMQAAVSLAVIAAVVARDQTVPREFGVGQKVMYAAVNIPVKPWASFFQVKDART